MSDTLAHADWDATIERFAASLRDEDRSALTVRNYTRELHAFARWYRGQYREPPELADVTADDLREYRDHLRARKLKPASINQARAALAGLLKWAHGARLIGEPIRTPRTARQVIRAPRWLTKQQERRLLKVIRKGGNDHHLGLVELMLVFGLRISEVAGLTWGDVTLGRSRAELRVMGKGSKERVLPFLGNDRAREAFTLLGWKERGSDRGGRILRGQRGPLTASGIKQLLTPYGTAAGLDRFSAHVLRHTCARRMFERDEPIQVIASWMGHESVNTTFRYTLPGDEDMKRAGGGAAGDDWPEDDG